MLFLSTTKFEVQSVCLTFKDGLISFPIFQGAKAGEITLVFDSVAEDQLKARALIMNLTPTVSEALFREVGFRLSSVTLENLNRGLHLYNATIYNFFGNPIHKILWF